MVIWKFFGNYQVKKGREIVMKKSKMIYEIENNGYLYLKNIFGINRIKERMFKFFKKNMVKRTISSKS